MNGYRGKSNPFLVFLYVGLVLLIIGFSADRVFLYVSIPFVALGVYGMFLALRQSNDDDHPGSIPKTVNRDGTSQGKKDE